VSKTPTFGLFDHIEDIPGTPTHQLFKDRLALIKMAEDAGLAAFHLAEHHGGDLCMAANQEVFVAAASQITSSIRLGPMVKLLPLHNPVRILEDMCVADQLTEGRLEYGVGRGAVPAEHGWFGSDYKRARERFTDTLGIIADALKTGIVSSENSAFYDFGPMPLYTKPYQETIPFWYPGNPVTAGKHGLSLMWPGPIDERTYETYVEAWNAHKGDRIRLDGPDSEPRIGITMMMAIRHDENEALDIAKRAMEGLTRRTEGGHRFDTQVLDTEEELWEAQAALRQIKGGLDIAIQAGSGTPDQIAERLSAILAPGLIDHVDLMIPTGDMTMDEAKRTLELFVTEVKPQLEMQPA
jgi:alkanesulfonate monooxygenase SsuD/methylene tetrahydromethanopterin reductase-like flavin-dependent oxidoreductase (luciferase family)